MLGHVPAACGAAFPTEPRSRQTGRPTASGTRPYILPPVNSEQLSAQTGARNRTPVDLLGRQLKLALRRPVLFRHRRRCPALAAPHCARPRPLFSYYRAPSSWRQAQERRSAVGRDRVPVRQLGVQLRRLAVSEWRHLHRRCEHMPGAASVVPGTSSASSALCSLGASA